MPPRGLGCVRRQFHLYIFLLSVDSQRSWQDPVLWKPGPGYSSKARKVEGRWRALEEGNKKIPSSQWKKQRVLCQSDIRLFRSSLSFLACWRIFNVNWGEQQALWEWRGHIGCLTPPARLFVSCQYKQKVVNYYQESPTQCQSDLTDGALTATTMWSVILPNTHRCCQSPSPSYLLFCLSLLCLLSLPIWPLLYHLFIINAISSQASILFCLHASLPTSHAHLPSPPSHRQHPPGLLSHPVTCPSMCQNTPTTLRSLMFENASTC